MVVTEHVAEVVVLIFLALRDCAGLLHLRRWRDVAAKSSPEVVIQDVAAETIEVCRADALVVRRLGGVFTCATVVAGI